MLVVSAWGGSDALPSLDPTSLYALAAVRLAFGAATAADAPPLTSTDPVPAAYTAGKIVARSAAEIAAHCAAHAPHVADSGAHGRAAALHALLDDRVRDFVLHALFSLPQNFARIAPCFAPQRVPPSSLARRMRNAVRARLESPHIRLWGAGGSWARADAAEAQRWNSSAGLARESSGNLAAFTPGILRHRTRAADVREEWERSRLRADARLLFAALASLIGPLEHPTLADAHLYATLAPLLYGPAVPTALLADVLREFPTLVTHTTRMHELLWTDARWAFTRAPSPAAAAPDWRALWAALWTRQSKPAPPAPLALRIGRAVWIAAAVIAPIAWVFLSGIITIEFVDDEEADEEGEEGEDADEEAGGSPADLAAEATDMDD